MKRCDGLSSWIFCPCLRNFIVVEHQKVVLVPRAKACYRWQIELHPLEFTQKMSHPF